MSGGAKVWMPSAEEVDGANVTRLMRGLGFASFEELLAASQADPSWFWDRVVHDLDIEFFEPYDEVLDLTDGPPWARWFVGGQINVAHNLLDRWATFTPDKAALIWEGEDGAQATMTYEALRDLSDRVAHYLVARGVIAGDRVAMFMPLLPEAIAAIHACEKVGAILLPLFSGYGPRAIIDRLQDAEAKVLFTADGFRRRSKMVRMKEVVDEALTECPSVETVVVVPRLGIEVTHETGRDVMWEEVLAAKPEIFRTARLDSEHPYLIAYTSGTTGKPKGCLHVHGGFLVKTYAEAAYQMNVKQDDVVCWMTDLGWVMGPWAIIAAGGAGATLFIYEGAPDYPVPHRLWEMVDRHRISALGLSPSLIRGLTSRGSTSLDRFDFGSLRVLGLTGEPCDPASYDWLFHEVGRGRCPITNMSGGTEAGSILSTYPVKPMKTGSLGGPALGMKVEVWVDDRVPAARGELGELVCTGPWPSMTRGIWRDEQRYLDQYWRRWPDVWVHGDWASVDADGYWFLHGRSDDVINIAGKRIGPAEVERALMQHPDVLDAAAVGIDDPVKGEVLWCFVVTDDPDRPLIASRIADHVAETLGKAFKPASVMVVEEMPKTRTGKIVRRALRSLVMGTDPGDLSALENPPSLSAISRVLAQRPDQG